MEPTFANFAPADWLILLIYCFFALAVGFSLRPFMKGSRDFLQAGRRMPAWLCGMAMAGAGLNSQALLGMGAAGAHFGLTSLSFVALGSIPAMLFAGLYLMPAYYGSSSKTGTAGVTARSIPEYLGLRFDPKTRLLSACLFAAMALFSAGIELYAMARVLTALHIFDQISSRLNLSDSGLLVLAVIFPALLVLTYVLLGGLGATVYNQALQFCVVVAGSLPMIILGLKRIGGWNGVRNAVPAGFLHEWNGGIQAGIHSTGIEPVGLLLSVGLVLGGGIWCTDFRLLQTAMAAKDVDSARKAPLIAAALWVLVPTLLVLPGLIATGLPTPHTTIFIRNENGAIYHDIAVVPAAAEAGKGLVPAKIDPSNGKPMKDSKGNVALDFAMAIPNMLLQVLPMGLLGLGIAALLACLMSGVAASLTAASTVFTCDLYQTLLTRDANDKRILAAARWAALGCTTLAIGVALATMHFNSILDAMLLVFAVVNGPLFAVLLLGAFWRHATGHGAFAGMIAGAAIALLHHGLDLPTGAQPGIHGGWIAVVHRPPNELVLDLSTATLAFLVSLLVTAGVSVGTKSRPKTELRGTVYSLMERRPANARWWKRPESLAVAILLAAVAVNLLWI